MSLKHMFFISIWAFISVISLMFAYNLGHMMIDRELHSKVNELYERFECKNNSCDRFKGKDAKELEARLMKQIESLRKECKKNG